MEAVNSDHSALVQSDVKQGSASMPAEDNKIHRKSYDINRMDIYIYVYLFIYIYIYIYIYREREREREREKSRYLAVSLINYVVEKRTAGTPVSLGHTALGSHD